MSARAATEGAGAGSLHSHRDIRGNRDSGLSNDQPRPGDESGDGGNRDNTGRPRFELFQNRKSYRNGVHWIGVKENKITQEMVELEPVWICSPLSVTATTRDGSGSEWGRMLVFADRDGRPHTWAMPMTMMAGSGEELRAELLRQGLEITSDTRMRPRLMDYIQSEMPSKTARCVTRTGWHGDTFVLPSKSFGESEAEPIIFQTSDPSGIALATAGTMEDWQQHVAGPCVGNSRLILALSAAFAGPCLGLLGGEGGGFHLRGSSSTGKTTALNVAASVFGPPSFARNWRQTDNALEAAASLHTDLLLILDEISQLDPKHAGACAYLLANGQGKGRASKDGSARATASFRLLFLSAGEIGLCDLVTEGGGRPRAGQEVRVVDIPADAGKGLGVFDQIPAGTAPGAFADQLKQAAAKYHGHPLPALLNRLASGIEAARTQLRTARDGLAEDWLGCATDGQVRRVAQRFALIAAAGELATDYGLTGWPAGEAQRAAHACFDSWLSARGSSGNAEPLAMLAQVRAFLSAHGESRFSKWDSHSGEPRTINRAGYRRETDNGPEYFVDREIFKLEIAKGFDARQVAQMLVAHGALRTEADGTTTRKERMPDGRSVRVYRITPHLWNDNDF